jgi:HEAT repeat protein/S1-C subfamily serine protease/DNA-directed RNA polymerase subunit RPC12/RpoP
MIRFSCPKCDTSLKSADDKAGTKTTCPRCGERLLVPAVSEPEKKSGGAGKPGGKTAVASKKGTKAKGAAAGEEKKSSPAIMIGAGVVALAVVGGGAAVFLMSNKKTEPAKQAEATPTLSQPAAPVPVAAARNPAPAPAAKLTSATAQAPGGPGASKPAAEVKPPSEAVVKPPSEIEAPSLQGDQVYKRLLKSTAWVIVMRNARQGNLEGVESEWGTGSLVDRQNKLILTNFHVIKGAEKGKLVLFFPEYKRNVLVDDRSFYLDRAMFKGEGLSAWVAYADATRDLALVKLGGELPDGIQQIHLANSSASPGQRVHSLGNPGASSSMWVYTFGTVRTRPHHRKWRAGEPKDFLDLEATVIETQSPTNHGDSGGPLVNDRGELVAVTQGGKGGGAQLVSTFIDVSEVRQVLRAYYKSENITPPADIAAKRDEPTDVAALLQELEAADPPKRARAAEVLGDEGSDARAAIPHLVRHLKDKDENVRKKSARAIEQIGSLTQGDLPGVVDAIKDPDPDVKVSAITAIKLMGQEADIAIPSLTEALHDPQTPVRMHAAKALGAMGVAAKISIPTLAKALESDKSPDVRAEAVLALSKMGPDAKAALPQLEAALKDPNLEVRLSILSAIASIGPDAKGVAPLLVKTMKEKNRDYRAGVIKALGAIGPDAAKDTLEPLIGSLQEAHLQRDATEALGKMGKPAVKPLTNLLIHRDPNIRACAVEALGEIGPDAKSAVDLLNRLAKFDRVPEVRDAAKEAVKKINPPK